MQESKYLSKIKSSSTDDFYKEHLDEEESREKVLSIADSFFASKIELKTVTRPELWPRRKIVIL